MEFERIEKMKKTKTYKQIIDELGLDITAQALRMRMKSKAHKNKPGHRAATLLTKKFLIENKSKTIWQIVEENNVSLQSVQRAEYRTGVKLARISKKDVKLMFLDHSDLPTYKRVPDDICAIVTGAWR